jgi:hypothetical protein
MFQWVWIVQSVLAFQISVRGWVTRMRRSAASYSERVTLQRSGASVVPVWTRVSTCRPKPS